MLLVLTDVFIGNSSATLADTTNSMPAHRPAMSAKGMRQKRRTKPARHAKIMAELKLRPVLVSYRAFDVEVARFKAERRTAPLVLVSYRAFDVEVARFKAKRRTVPRKTTETSQAELTLV
jgi:hypothetical protein